MGCAVSGSVLTQSDERCSMLLWSCGHVPCSNVLADQPAVKVAVKVAVKGPEQWHRVFSGRQVPPAGLA